MNSIRSFATKAGKASLKPITKGSKKTPFYLPTYRRPIPIVVPSPKRTKKSPPSPFTGVPKRNFFTVIDANERGVRLTLGKFNGQVLQPGLRMLLPFIQSIGVIDVRDRVIALKPQKCISKDNVSFLADAVVSCQVVDAAKAVLGVKDLEGAIESLASLKVREITSTMTVQDILDRRVELGQTLKESLKSITERWGCEIHAVQIRDISFEDEMKRALAKEAEESRVARAKLISAQADIETAKKYSEAAAIYSENPVTLRLCEFQLWQNVAKEQGNFLAVIPSDVLNLWKKD